MVEDVTQRKQAQQALRRAERLSSIGTLAAGIAHEVNNPLGAIQLDAETAIYCIEQPEKRETVAACLQNIAASAQRGAQIVRDVLRFARTDRHPKATDDLRGAVERACRLTRRVAEKSGARILYQPPDDELPVRFNSTEIEQVIVNLITNAVQASPSGARIEIVLQRDADSACVLVRDFGRGMSPDQADRIFDPFYTTREGEGGTGLGLSISYGIVREHEGTINVETCPDAGTTMIVRLPLEATGPDGRGGVE
jgi:signal transduction histidine kinase